MARRGIGSSADQVDAAIYGSNVGSMLFPLSNLTNLLVVSASGVTFAAFVGAAALPQLAAAVVVGALLYRRLARQPAGPVAAVKLPSIPRTPRLLAGAAALLSSVAAVAPGFLGGDVPRRAEVLAACAVLLLIG